MPSDGSMRPSDSGASLHGSWPRWRQGRWSKAQKLRHQLGHAVHGGRPTNSCLYPAGTQVWGKTGAGTPSTLLCHVRGTRLQSSARLSATRQKHQATSHLQSHYRALAVFSLQAPSHT